MSGTRNVLVIGGGVAGPVAALALRKAGIDATVYEAVDMGTTHFAFGTGRTTSTGSTRTAVSGSAPTCRGNGR